jgi:hypothetical protein
VGPAAHRSLCAGAALDDEVQVSEGSKWRWENVNGKEKCEEAKSVKLGWRYVRV